MRVVAIDTLDVARAVSGAPALYVVSTEVVEGRAHIVRPNAHNIFEWLRAPMFNSWDVHKLGKPRGHPRDQRVVAQGIARREAFGPYVGHGRFTCRNERVQRETSVARGGPGSSGRVAGAGGPATPDRASMSRQPGAQGAMGRAPGPPNPSGATRYAPQRVATRPSNKYRNQDKDKDNDNDQGRQGRQAMPGGSDRFGDRDSFGGSGGYGGRGGPGRGGR